MPLYFPLHKHNFTPMLMSLSVIFILLHSCPFAWPDSPTHHHFASPASRRRLLTIWTHWGPTVVSHCHSNCSESGSERRPHSCPQVRDCKWVDGAKREDKRLAGRVEVKEVMRNSQSKQTNDRRWRKWPCGHVVWGFNHEWWGYGLY